MQDAAVHKIDKLCTDEPSKKPDATCYAKFQHDACVAQVNPLAYLGHTLPN